MPDNLKSMGLTALIWDFFGKIARHGTTFIVTIILARILEPSDFGLIAMIMVIVMIALVFTDVGLGSALIQRRRLLLVHYSSVFYFNVFIGVILTVITIFSASWISDFYNNEELVPVTQVTALLFVINAFSSVQTNILRKQLNYAALAKADVAAALLSGITSIGFALYGAGVWSLVIQALSRGVYYNLFVWSASKWVPSLLFSFKALMQLWGFGFRIFLSTILEVVYSKLDVLIIGKLFTPAVLGFFDQAKRLDLMITQLSSGSIMAVLFPVLSKVQNDLPRFQHIVINTLRIISFVVFFLLGVMYVISEELIVFLFTEKWLPSVAYFKILLLSGFAYPISALLVDILMSRGNSKAFLRLEIYKKILQSINFYVGFLWGIEGYLYGLVIVAVLSVSLNILFASREIKLAFFVFLKPIIVQMLISFIIVWLVILSTEEIEIYGILMLVMKSTMFTVLYFIINKLVKTSSYGSFEAQLSQILKRRKG
ncbi:lipopolysaccharide biosynthesis protein [Sulfurovum sp. XGS-02]|uniref:lipopolysaccharide biosynthesis protein n=1 Tax=Sulfurovum sp. XGS-02 TaxID=2925411 RepID=UPI0020467639|nr:lipopolysaccharide biosynthesis protein [Sulfurovum sp. XGS-02]UPT76816.1 lipopolysaccharide biosynthesis protein [Sulfurovum sp. XGS-02]